jgi:hypothetical protein
MSSTTSCFGEDFFPNESLIAGGPPLPEAKFSFVSRSACALGMAYVP